MGTQTNLPTKFIFASDFGHFILKMLDYAKFVCVKKKVAEMLSFLGGTFPADFSTAGDESSPPPLSAPMN